MGSKDISIGTGMAASDSDSYSILFFPSVLFELALASLFLIPLIKTDLQDDKKRTRIRGILVSFLNIGTELCDQERNFLR